MTLHLASLLWLGLAPLAYEQPGDETTFAYRQRGIVYASHVGDGYVNGSFTTPRGRRCTFDVIVWQPTGCVVHARGCGLRQQEGLCITDIPELP